MTQLASSATLSIALELYSPTGTLVASDSNGAIDGRNALLTHIAATTGIYKVRVLGSSNKGEYVLTMTGGSGVHAPFHVNEVSPANGAFLIASPSKGTIHFNDGLMLTSLVASDVTFQGSPVSGLNVVDGNTIEFDLPPGLTNGSYTIAIGAGAILDLQGTSIASFTSTFSIDNDNAAPNIVVPAKLSINEDQALVIQGLDVSDSDSGVANISVVLSVSHGTLLLSTNVVGGLTAGQIAGNGTAVVTITAPVAAISASLVTGPLYNPNADFVGTDLLVIQANDLGNTGGAAQLDIDSVEIVLGKLMTPGQALWGDEHAGGGSHGWPSQPGIELDLLWTRRRQRRDATVAYNHD